MKLAPALLLPILFALPARTGQSQSTPKKEVTSLDLGSVTVWLGMTKEETLKRLSVGGNKPKDLGDAIGADTGTGTHVLQFKNNRLVFADLEWHTEHTVVHEIDAVLGALGALAQKNDGHPCTVVHAPLSSPNSSSDRVFVVCGKRSVLISKWNYEGKLTVSVSERIGDMPNREE